MPRLGTVRSLCVCHGGCPVACCLPLVLARIPQPGCCGSFMLAGGLLADLEPRKGEAIGRRYLAGRYGATPHLSSQEFKAAAKLVRSGQP